MKLGAFNSVCAGLLPQILKSFMASFPQIEVEVYQGTYDDVKEWLRKMCIRDSGYLRRCRSWAHSPPRADSTFERRFIKLFLIIENLARFCKGNIYKKALAEKSVSRDVYKRQEAMQF